MQQVKFFCKKKVNSRWTGVFSSAMRKKIFASKKIWFGNSRTNVFLGQNILFRLRIICTCCLYKHACRKLDWSTSFKIHIRCPGIWQNSSLIFDFFFFENSNFIKYFWDETLKTFSKIGKIKKETLLGPENKWVHYFCIKSLKRKPASYPRSINAEV